MKKAFLLAVGISLCAINGQDLPTESVVLTSTPSLVQADTQPAAQPQLEDAVNLRRQDGVDHGQSANVRAWKDSDKFRNEGFDPDLTKENVEHIHLDLSDSDEKQQNDQRQEREHKLEDFVHKVEDESHQGHPKKVAKAGDDSSTLDDSAPVLTLLNPDERGWRGRK